MDKILCEYVRSAESVHDTIRCQHLSREVRTVTVLPISQIDMEIWQHGKWQQNCIHACMSTRPEQRC